MAEQVKAKRGNVIDAFVDGARNGLKIAFNSMLPNTLFGFTLTIILNLTGLADVIGVVFAPVMRIFGLPGVAATAVMAIFLSMGGAAGVTVYRRPADRAPGGDSAARAAALRSADPVYGTASGNR